MQRGRYPIGDMNTNHDKPLTGFEPAKNHEVATHCLNHLATRAEGGEREKYQQKPLTVEQNTAHNEQSILAHRKE